VVAQVDAVKAGGAYATLDAREVVGVVRQQIATAL